MDTYLPPKYSMNAFFVRHVAHPRRMKYISGLNNARICAVNDVGYINNINTTDSVNFPPNNYNDQVIKSNVAKRKEKAIPPNGPWRTFGLSNLFFFFRLLNILLCYLKTFNIFLNKFS